MKINWECEINGVLYRAYRMKDGKVWLYDSDGVATSTEYSDFLIKLHNIPVMPPEIHKGDYKHPVVNGEEY